MNEPDPGSGFFKELARRRVFRSAGAYAVVAWVAIQAGSIVLPEFGAPDWAMRALIILFIAGFPPAMLLAWTLDFSAKGLVRTRESRYAGSVWPKLAVAVTATAISAGVLWWVWDDYIVQTRERPARAAIRSQPVVAVQEPRHLAGRSANAWLGDGIATLIRSELSESRHVIVISRARWNAMTADVANADLVSQRAREIGVDYLIDGELIETPDGIVLTTHVEDIESGIEIASTRTSGADVADIIAGVRPLSIEIKQALRIPHQEKVGLFEADFAIGNVEAYEAYIAGLAYFQDFEYQAAEDAFEAVLELAPDYHIARFRLAQVYESTGRSELARRTLDEIPTDANLSDRLHLYVEGAKAYFAAERDPASAIEIYSRLVELYPYETEAGLLLAEAYWLDFQDDAAIAELRRVSEIHPYDPTSWMALGERLMDVGELDEAKAALERFAQMEPGDPLAFAMLGNLALLRGDVGASIRQHERALGLRPDFVVSMLGLARARYLNGEVAEAQSTWSALVADGKAAAGYRIDAAFDLAGMLRGRGLFSESIEPIEQVMPLIREEGLQTARALSEQGSAWLELGDAERARALIDEAVRQAPAPATRYLFARGMLELHLRRFEALDATVAEIRSLASGDEPDRTEAKAADYLAGLAALARESVGHAGEFFRSAVDEPGYQYGIYRLGLARYHAAAGDYAAASELALQAASERDRGDLRLDLELDRARARLLYAETLARSGSGAAARQEAGRFLDWWKEADPGRPEIIEARALLEKP